MTEITVSPDFYHKSICELRDNIALGFLNLGKLCKEVKEDRIYTGLGYETFEEYLASVGLSRASVYRFIQIYERFVLGWGVAPDRLAPIGWSKLGDILPVSTEENREEWLSKAESLTRSDLITEIRGETGRAVCENHEYESVMKCKVCGYVRRGE